MRRRYSEEHAERGVAARNSADGRAAGETARQAAHERGDQRGDVLAQRCGAFTHIVTAQRTAEFDAQHGAPHRALFEWVLRAPSSALRKAHAFGGFQHDDVGDQPLELVEPSVRERLSLARERIVRRRCFQKRHEPFQPQQRPAVIPLEALCADGWTGKLHARAVYARCEPGRICGLGFYAAVL